MMTTIFDNDIWSVCNYSEMDIQNSYFFINMAFLNLGIT